ncbi:protein TolR [Solidesulfovibrio fructosivorans]|nr:protein TolR [Solidesulfovibrio fructosivorans]
MAMMTGGSGKFLGEVNVTPFVDVMLVLLIIFMVTAPMMTQGLQVDLPQTRAVSVLPKENESVVLTIKADGSLYLDKYQVELGDLEGQVRQLVSAQKKQLFLRADKAVPYGTVVAVMGVVKAAGVDRLGVVAEEEKKS